MPLAFNVSTHAHCILCKCARVTRSYGRARTRLWCKIMSGLNVAQYNRGLQFCDVRILQSDLEFVDYHRRSTRELIKRRGGNTNEQDPHLLPEITARLGTLKRKM